MLHRASSQSQEGYEIRHRKCMLRSWGFIFHETKEVKTETLLKLLILGKHSGYVAEWTLEDIKKKIK